MSRHRLYVSQLGDVKVNMYADACVCMHRCMCLLCACQCRCLDVDVCTCVCVSAAGLQGKDSSQRGAVLQTCILDICFGLKAKSHLRGPRLFSAKGIPQRVRPNGSSRGRGSAAPSEAGPPPEPGLGQWSCNTWSAQPAPWVRDTCAYMCIHVHRIIQAAHVRHA